MKAWRIVGGFFLFLSLVGGMPAQPEKMLREAMDRLWAAGNYSWEKASEASVDGRKLGPLRRSASEAGETNIGGFTVAVSHGKRMIFTDKEIAWLLKSGWRHADDLTDADLRELAGLRPEANVPRARLGDRRTHPGLPHELLRGLLGEVRGTRQQGAAIVCDLGSLFGDPFALEGYMAHGGLSPTALDRRRYAGLSDAKTELVVWLDGGNIAEFAVDFHTTRLVANGPDQGNKQAMVNSVVVKLFKIGTTKVEIDPEALALFR
jgi:hypothetical protein